LQINDSVGVWNTSCVWSLQRRHFFAQFSNFLHIRIIEYSARPSQQVNPLAATALPVYCSTPPVSTYIWYQEPFTSALDKVFNHNTVSFFRGSCSKCGLGNSVTNLEQADDFDILNDIYYML
jgi:hypothetical protein